MRRTRVHDEKVPFEFDDCDKLSVQGTWLCDAREDLSVCVYTVDDVRACGRPREKCKLYCANHAREMRRQLLRERVLTKN